MLWIVLACGGSSPETGDVGATLTGPYAESMGFEVASVRAEVPAKGDELQWPGEVHILFGLEGGGDLGIAVDPAVADQEAGGCYGLRSETLTNSWGFFMEGASSSGAPPIEATLCPDTPFGTAAGEDVAGRFTSTWHMTTTVDGVEVDGTGDMDGTFATVIE